jgi:hypothetical protein
MVDRSISYGHEVQSVSSGVSFLHYGDMTNVGDYLSSPRHYFEFRCEKRALVVGGGASNNYFAKRALGIPGARVLWGVGQSWPFGKDPSSFNQKLKSLLRRLAYQKASTRDRTLASATLPLVPCASVFHPIVDLPPGDSVSVVVNGNPRVSADLDILQHRLKQSAFKLDLVTNTLPLGQFMQAFARSRTIVTNSYHAAYWGLLSGREVHIVGYSSKFTSVAALFGFSASTVIRVGRGDGLALADAILASPSRMPLQLANADRDRREFRQLNLHFAESLREIGIEASLTAAEVSRDHFASSIQHPAVRPMAVAG